MYGRNGYYLFNNGTSKSEDDKKILLNLHSDWYAKRRAFYEVLPEYEIPA
ncbi:hypothetical protein ACFWGC_08220 [Cytobacillus pseudoceanisediminis]|nr:hypothetical protein [Cytobacillus sp. Bac17]